MKIKLQQEVWEIENSRQNVELVLQSIEAVSYTHLDVYKRQRVCWKIGLPC